MRHSILIFLLFLVPFKLWPLKPSVVKETLGSADCLFFSNHIYVYGYVQKGKELFVKVIRYTIDLQKLNETSIFVGMAALKGFHPLNIDTVHEFISFTAQQIDNEKTALLIRLDHKLETIAVIKDAEISRINFAAFDKEKLYDKKNLFLIRPISSDSSHNYFLQKYHLIDSSRVYEYKLDWQFGFDKNSYKNCHIIGVNKKNVFVFVNAIAGKKKGQWVIFINLTTGEFENACKLNSGDAKEEFIFSSAFYNAETKELAVTGERVSLSANLDDTKIQNPLNKLKFLNLFVCLIDSLSELIEKRIDFIPVPVELSKEKELKAYAVKTSKFLYKNGEYSFFNELLAETNPHIYKTYGFLFSQFSHNENGQLMAGQSYFSSVFRNKEIKVANQLVNTYEYSKNTEADKLLYQSPTLTSFIGFAWNIDFSNKIIKNVAMFQNKNTGKRIYYCFNLNEAKWQNKEMCEGNKASKTKLITINTRQYLLFNFTSQENNKEHGDCMLELKNFD